MYRDIELARALSKLPVLKEVDELKHQIDALRPLPREVEERVLQKFRLDWNYHSNAIEGNPYTYGETVAFLMEGITAKGKTLKDHLDIKGHDDAIQYLLKVVKEKDYRLTEHEIRNLHKMLLKEPYFSDAVTADGLVTKKEIKLGAYKSMPNHVKTPTGAIHYYASPEETPIKMGELVEWFNNVIDDKEVHPVVVASLFHHQFTAIHPFDDGNGRMARLLMNLILMQKGYPAVVIKQQDRNNYYQVLRRADAGEHQPIIEYIAEILMHSLSIYLRGSKGESIDEKDDLDKEIALFKLTLGQDLPQTRVGDALIKNQLINSIIPLFQFLVEKLRDQFAELFFDNNVILVSSDISGRRPLGMNVNTLDEYIDLIDSYWLLTPNTIRSKQLESLTLEIYFNGFKKSHEPFNVSFRMPVRFDEFKYRINYQSDNKSQIQKFYHEFLSATEIENITRDALKALLNDIKFQVEIANRAK